MSGKIPARGGATIWYQEVSLQVSHLDNPPAQPRVRNFDRPSWALQCMHWKIQVRQSPGGVKMIKAKFLLCGTIKNTHRQAEVSVTQTPRHENICRTQKPLNLSHLWSQHAWEPALGQQVPSLRDFWALCTPAASGQEPKPGFVLLLCLLPRAHLGSAEGTTPCAPCRHPQSTTAALR